MTKNSTTSSHMYRNRHQIPEGVRRTKSWGFANARFLGNSHAHLRKPLIAAFSRHNFNCFARLTPSTQNRFPQRSLHLIHSLQNLHPALDLPNDTIKIVSRTTQPLHPIVELVVQLPSLTPDMRNSRSVEHLRVVNPYGRLRPLGFHLSNDTTNNVAGSPGRFADLRRGDGLLSYLSDDVAHNATGSHLHYFRLATSSIVSHATATGWPASRLIQSRRPAIAHRALSRRRERLRRRRRRRSGELKPSWKGTPKASNRSSTLTRAPRRRADHVLRKLSHQHILVWSQHLSADELRRTRAENLLRLVEVSEDPIRLRGLRGIILVLRGIAVGKTGGAWCFLCLLLLGRHLQRRLGRRGSL
jgi:hypothetical protein